MTEPYRCWDCGSTDEKHHTKLCELAPDGAIRDLVAAGDTQWWVGSPAGRNFKPGREMNFLAVPGAVVNSKTTLPGAGAYYEGEGRVISRREVTPKGRRR